MDGPKSALFSVVVIVVLSSCLTMPTEGDIYTRVVSRVNERYVLISVSFHETKSNRKLLNS